MVRFRIVIFALVGSLMGCGPKVVVGDWETGNLPEEETGSGDSADSADEDDEHSCDQVELDLLGPEAPIVGDTWTIWVDCDGTRLLGPMVVRFEPSDFALVDDNVAVFQYAGKATLNVRSGVYALDTEVTVTEE